MSSKRDLVTFIFCLIILFLIDNTIRRRKDDICVPNEVGNNTPTHNICYFLFHCDNGNGNALQCYVTRTLPVLFVLRMYVVQYGGPQ